MNVNRPRPMTCSEVRDRIADVVAQVTFDAADHRYETDGREVPSVSRILQRTGWSQSYAQVPAWVLAQARDRGIAWHAEADRTLQTGETDDAVLRDTYDTLMREGWTVMATEPRLVAQVQGVWIGGTPDAVLAQEQHGTVLVHVVDFKRTAMRLAGHALQVAGYQMMLQAILGTPHLRMSGRLVYCDPYRHARVSRLASVAWLAAIQSYRLQQHDATAFLQVGSMR